jgi:hypothetical protein
VAGARSGSHGSQLVPFVDEHVEEEISIEECELCWRFAQKSTRNGSFTGINFAALFSFRN